MDTCPARAWRSGRTRSRRCSTRWPPATTAPTTCSPSARTGAGAAPWSRPSTCARASSCSTWRPAPGTSTAPFADAGVLAVPVRLLPRDAPGRQARRRRTCRSWPGDATRLPFADGAFDAVTISFGLRNVGDTAAALAEMRRVTRHGGRLVVCEFSHPTWAPWRRVYTEYLMRALPAVARRVSSSPDSYVYLAESIRAWPDQRRLGELVAAGRLGRGGLPEPVRRDRRPAPRRPRLTRRRRATSRRDRRTVWPCLRIACCVAGQ